MTQSITQQVIASLSGQQALQLRMVLDRGIKIPPQPRILEELQKQMQNKTAELRVMARTISRDPGIAGLLFKAVQTPAYREHQPFDSLEHVLQAIGVKQTYNIVQAIALGSSVTLPNDRRLLEAFWARAHAIAQLAMIVAGDRAAICNIFPDQAFLAGIFHDCGVPVLMQRFPTYCQDMRLHEIGRWADLGEEDRRFAADHCVVGYLVGRHWHLPDFICDAIRFHHEVGQSGSPAGRSMVAILQMAIHAYELSMQLESREWPRVESDVLNELGLHPDDCSEYLDDLLDLFHAAVGV